MKIGRRDLQANNKRKQGLTLLRKRPGAALAAGSLLLRLQSSQGAARRPLGRLRQILDKNV